MAEVFCSGNPNCGGYEVGPRRCWNLLQAAGPTCPGQYTMPLHASLRKFWVPLAGNCGTMEFSGVRTVCLCLTTSSPAESRTAAGRPGVC